MIRIFRNLTAKEWLMALCSVVLVVLQVHLELLLPDYMKEITVLVTTGQNEVGDVLAAGGKMLACAFASVVTAFMTAVLAAKIAANFSAATRKSVFDKVESFSMAEIGRFSTASLITRCTNDVTQVQMLIVLGLSAMLRAPIMAAMAIGKIADKSWQWTTATAVAVAALLAVVVLSVLLTLPKFRRLQALTDDINRVTRENLSGLSVVRAYNAAHYQEEKFDRVNDTLTNTHLFTSITMSFLLPFIGLVLNGLSLAIYWIGAVIINDAKLPMEKFSLFSDMIVFTSYAMQVVMSFMMLVMIFIIIPRASVSAKRILEVMDTEPSIVDGDTTEGVKGMEGTVEFKNVSFKYPDAEDNVLSNISFTAKQGETVAFIGSTGCGKTTVVNLIPRFYDVSSGEVLVDGVDVRKYTQEALRKRIGYVSQKAILFSGNIMENVVYGSGGAAENMDADAMRAIEVAQAKEFVDKENVGLKGHVSQGGSNFSGGQKQRLSIARAVARKPEILIFDDSFSALDYKTDRTLRNALKNECASSTKLIVAQRIGTIRDADRIIVLEDGEIAGCGTHTELLKDCEVYKQIALSQLSKEELDG